MLSKFCYNNKKNEHKNTQKQHDIHTLKNIRNQMPMNPYIYMDKQTQLLIWIDGTSLLLKKLLLYILTRVLLGVMDKLSQEVLD